MNYDPGRFTISFKSEAQEHSLSFEGGICLDTFCEHVYNFLKAQGYYGVNRYINPEGIEEDLRFEDPDEEYVDK